MLGIEVGESVHFCRVPPPGQLAKLDSSWEQDIMVGYESNSGEYIISTTEALYKKRTVRRRPNEDRWDKDSVEKLKWVPWQVRDSTVRKTGEPDDENEQEITHVDIQVGRYNHLRNRASHPFQR